ncbi:carbohydrate-binding protein [Micromonospora psammae]|uniref:carbohydrate-binding protein n=1 Tax=Micromonospora sp. CPCC 205556 TaxID=3122398 RepID=UPI002FF39863
MSPSPRRRWSRLLHAALLSVTGSVVAVTGATTPATAHTTIDPADYQQVTLAIGSAELGQAMSLAVLPNRSVLHTARDGTVRLTDAAGNTSVAGKLTVYTHDEEGLQGVAVDPNFASNRHVYLYYSPKLSTPAGDAPKTGTATDWTAWKGELWLSRFVLTTAGTLDLASEKVVLKVPSDRGLCCHVGGDIDFDAAGNLYLTTGDDTNPFESAGSSPIDERTERNPQFDAQRTSANTNDLRGKLLRIKVNADGSYSIPSGNLFPVGTAKTRPEIYAMGFRNPFRMSVDRATGVVYLGDYGPDGGAITGRGPAGQVEFDRIPGPGNYGWPYCTGTNTPEETYHEWDFATGTGGAKYACATGPTNNSFRNTGLTTLPPAKASWIRYGGSAGSPPEFGSGSESPMGGPVYRYNAALNSSVKFPADLDGHYFAGEYGRKWIKAIDVNADGSPGPIASFPWQGTQVMDMAFGPDGALYVLDYGTSSTNVALYRVEYKPGPKAPVAKASANRTSGAAPLTVTFSSAGSSDPEGGTLSHRWTFGDGGTSTAANPSHTYTTNGQYTATLTVTDPTGLTATASVPITVGNTAPVVTLVSPAAGQLFAFGDTVPFTVTVTDAEDGTVDCAKVTVTYLIGHDSHDHALTSKTGCTGSITVPVDGEHDASANLYGVFDAEYTDAGGLTTHARAVLQPRHRQAEHHFGQVGIQVVDHVNAEGGKTVGFVNNGDWISFQPYRLSGAATFTARVSSAGAGGAIQVRAGSSTGTLLGSVTVPVTGSWESFTTVSTALAAAPSGSGPLFLVFTGGSGNLFDLDAFTFTPPVEAESYSSQSGVQVASHPHANGGRTVGYVNNGDWTGYATVPTAGRTKFAARISSGAAGGTIQVRAGSSTGTLLGSVTVPSTGGWDTFQTVSTTLTAAGSGPLFLVYTGAGTGFLFDVDSFTLS